MTEPQPKLKPEVKRLWLDALRSGKYKHGKYTLHHEDGKGNHTFCCLGVLCDLYPKKHWIKLEMGDHNMLGAEVDLPVEVIKWAFQVPDDAEPCWVYGLHNAPFADDRGALTQNLIELNDAHSTTDYSGVIKAIEEHF